jgi:hypothetical protein
MDGEDMETDSFSLHAWSLQVDAKSKFTHPGIVNLQ